MVEDRPKRIKEFVLTGAFALAAGTYAYFSAKTAVTTGDFQTSLIYAGMALVLTFGTGIIDWAPLRFEHCEDEKERRRREKEGADRRSDSEKKEDDMTRRKRAKDAYILTTKYLAGFSLVVALTGGWMGYKETHAPQQQKQIQPAPQQETGSGKAIKFQTPYAK